MSDFKTKMHQIQFRLGLRPKPHYRNFLDLPDGFKGLLLSEERRRDFGKWKVGKGEAKEGEK